MKRNFLVDYKLHETVLIDSKNREPKSYVIIFKYFASFIKLVGYIEFDVNVSWSIKPMM